MAGSSVKLQKTSQSRVFTIRYRAGPANAPVYQQLARAQAASWPQGDLTPVRIPDPDTYEKFITVEMLKGPAGLPTLGLQFRKTRDISDILRIVREGCTLDVQVHVGACKVPSDFNAGWELIQVLEGASPTSYDTDELGALDADQNAAVNETLALSGLDYYELKPLGFSELAGATIYQHIVDVAICDARTCGECGLASDGCQKVFALQESVGSSPGVPGRVIYTENGGSTFGSSIIDTLGLAEDPVAFACVGTNLAVISDDSGSIHYADIASLLDGLEVWVEVSTGIVMPTGKPMAIFSLGRTQTWIVGTGGYVYFSEDITAGVSVQSAGTVVATDLLAIHGSSANDLVAVGKTNAVLVTENGGETWSSVTGPVPGVDLNTVFCRATDEWVVGTANGKLYYTRDGGVSWTEKTFPGSGSGQVREVTFPTPSVGYMAHQTALTKGRLLRSIDGGYSWYVLPEGTGSIPSSDDLAAIAACRDDPNIVFAGGIADNSTDGILIKGA